MTPKKMKPSEVLIKAKGLLNAHPEAWIKWVGNKLTASGPAFCALGAVCEATKDDYGICDLYYGTKIVVPFLTPAAREIADELGRPLNEKHRGDPEGRVGPEMEPAYFNNTANSLDEVNKMFCRAIEKAVDAEIKEGQAG